MSAFRTDGTFTTASACGAARTSYPLGGADLTAKVISQDFMIAFASYAAPTISGTHGTFTTAYLIGDSDLQDLGGGIARFTRQWATIPANRSEWGTFGYQFPGLLDDTATPPYNQYWIYGGTGRDPRTEPAKSRLYHEYFLCKSGQTYTSPSAIPVIDATKYTLDSNGEAVIAYLLPNGVFGDDSDPTKEEYIAVAAGGSGLGTGAAAGEVVAERSTIERYMGEIYVRMTRYVLAE